METPADVLIHNQILGLKGGKGVLIRVSKGGYYELNLKFGERTHRVFLPISDTVVIQRQPEVEVPVDLEVER